jgi:hypothetical protein
MYPTPVRFLFSRTPRYPATCLPQSLDVWAAVLSTGILTRVFLKTVAVNFAFNLFALVDPLCTCSGKVELAPDADVSPSKVVRRPSPCVCELSSGRKLHDSRLGPMEYIRRGCW